MNMNAYLERTIDGLVERFLDDLDRPAYKHVSAELVANLLEVIFPEVYAAPPGDDTPTDTRRQSAERMTVYGDRVRRGRAVFHENDF